MLTLSVLVIASVYVGTYLLVRIVKRERLVRKLMGLWYYKLFLPHEFSNFHFYEHYFLKQSGYFKLLNPKEQLEFIYRVCIMKNSYKIEGTDGLNLTFEDMLHICGTMVMVTFGYNTDYLLGRYYYIKVYPGAFRSRFIDAPLKGLTFSKGRIHLSWEHYLEGFKDGKDRVNLGIHEFSHALKIECEHFESYPLRETWINQCDAAIASLRSGSQSIFRNYGATNIDEFWAVSVETYFEDPKGFKMHHPNLYNSVCDLLRQDLANRVEMLPYQNN